MAETPLGKDEIDVLILSDGNCRVKTGDMRGAKHASADQLIKEFQRLMGGSVEIQKAKDAHLHQHDHTHHHEHQ